MGETGRMETKPGPGPEVSAVGTDSIPVSHRTTAVLVVGLLVAYWGSVGTSTVGPNVPYVRQIIGFVLLTIVPGTLLTGCSSDPPTSSAYSSCTWSR